MDAALPLPRSSALELQHDPDAGWLTVWFPEPDRRNPLTAERSAALSALCKALAARCDIRGVTFRGRGGVFCAGGDLKGFGEMLAARDRAAVEAASVAAGEMFAVVAALPQFTVMAVEGAALAGGLGLAACGDMVIALADARLGLTETRLGLTPAQIAPHVLARCGGARGRRLMLMGEVLDARRAAEIGLVDELADDIAALERAEAACREALSRVAPGAVAETKALLADLPGLTGAAARERAARAFANCLLSGEAAEGVAAFIERRPPGWVSGSFDRGAAVSVAPATTDPPPTAAVESTPRQAGAAGRETTGPDDRTARDGENDR